MSGPRVPGWALTGSDIGTIKLWDLNTGAELLTLGGHSEEIVAVSADFEKQQALSGSDDKTLKLWDLDTGRLLRTFAGHTRGVKDVAADFERQRALSSSSDSTLKLWDLNADEALRTFTDTSGTFSLAVDFGQQRALCTDWEHNMKLWNLESGQVLCTFEGHTQCIAVVAADFSKQLALSGSHDCTMKLWNLEDGAPRHTFTEHTQAVEYLSVDFERQQALSGDQDTLMLWDLNTCNVVRTFIDTVCAMSADFERGLAVWGSDCELKVWDLSDGGAEVRSLSGHADFVTAVFADFREPPKVNLTIFIQGDSVRCYQMSGELAGPQLDGASMDDVTMEDWCRTIADFLKKPLHRLNFLDIDVKPGLTVRQAVKGVLGINEEGGSSSSIQYTPSTPEDEGAVAELLHNSPRN